MNYVYLGSESVSNGNLFASMTSLDSNNEFVSVLLFELVLGITASNKSIRSVYSN